ncbi:MAG TPA: glycosyltransferase, partial [bacterium]|nr:glycosyltransferase [bacterium]
NKFSRVLVGADDTVYTRSEEPPAAAGFKVLFFGSFLPLHGADVIIKAAKILENEADIEFILVGEGDTHDEAVKLSCELGARNVRFSPATTFSGIAKHIAACHVCLGIFGTTEKAARVIPNKAYQALACGRALLTADTPAIREVLTDRENVLLCRAGDPESLAESILELKRDPELRHHIASTGYELFKNNLTPEKIVEPMLEALGIRP